MSSDSRVTIYLQSSEGRFELSFDRATALIEVKKTFKRGIPQLRTTPMASFILSYRGKLLMEESITLASENIKDEDTLFLLRRSTIPSLEVVEEEQ